MEQVKKARGAWVIHVRKSGTEQGNGAKHSPASSDGTAQCNEHRNETDKKEE